MYLHMAKTWQKQKEQFWGFKSRTRLWFNETTMLWCLEIKYLTFSSWLFQHLTQDVQFLKTYWQEIEIFFGSLHVWCVTHDTSQEGNILLLPSAVHSSVRRVSVVIWLVYHYAVTPVKVISHSESLLYSRSQLVSPVGAIAKSAGRLWLASSYYLSLVSFRICFSFSFPLPVGHNSEQLCLHGLVPCVGSSHWTNTNLSGHRVVCFPNKTLKSSVVGIHSKQKDHLPVKCVSRISNLLLKISVSRHVSLVVSQLVLAAKHLGVSWHYNDPSLVLLPRYCLSLEWLPLCHSVGSKISK